MQAIFCPRRRRLLSALAAGATGSALGPLAAQTSDASRRTVRIVVGYAPGGTTDIIARLIAPGLGEALGQSVIVENKPGAAGNLGAAAVAAAPADGSTLMMGTAGNMTVNPWIYDLKFDTRKDFAPISLVAAVPNIMVVHPSVPARTAQEFIAWARERPGKVFFASSGTGNTPHMTGELFNLKAGLRMVHVPYKGSAPALADLIAGQGVHVSFDNMPSAVGHVRSGALRALAVTGASRSPAMPELPTLQEAGLTDFDVQGWFGLFAPAGTPPATVQRLHQAVMSTLAQPATRKSLQELGAAIVGNEPAAFGERLSAELRTWGEVVKAADIKLQ